MQETLAATLLISQPLQSTSPHTTPIYMYIHTYNTHNIHGRMKLLCTSCFKFINSTVMICFRWGVWLRTGLSLSFGECDCGTGS